MDKCEFISMFVETWDLLLEIWNTESLNAKEITRCNATDPLDFFPHLLVKKKEEEKKKTLFVFPSRCSWFFVFHKKQEKKLKWSNTYLLFQISQTTRSQVEYFAFHRTSPWVSSYGIHNFLYYIHCDILNLRACMGVGE